MKHCELTKLKYDDKYMTKIDTDKWVNYQLYLKVANDIKKSIFTYKEALKVFNFNKTFNSLLTEYLYKIRKEIKEHLVNGERRYRLEANDCKHKVKSFVEIEDAYTKLFLNKTVGCMTKEELFDYLNLLLSHFEFKDENRTISNGIEAQEIYDQYTKSHTNIQFFSE